MTFSRCFWTLSDPLVRLFNYTFDRQSPKKTRDTFLLISSHQTCAKFLSTVTFSPLFEVDLTSYLGPHFSVCFMGD